jgi:hypothetical protein
LHAGRKEENTGCGKEKLCDRSGVEAACGRLIFAHGKHTGKKAAGRRFYGLEISFARAAESGE